MRRVLAVPRERAEPKEHRVLPGQAEHKDLEAPAVPAALLAQAVAAVHLAAAGLAVRKVRLEHPASLRAQTLSNRSSMLLRSPFSPQPTASLMRIWK